jgi:hypothetical protein
MPTVLTARRLLRSVAYAISHPRYGFDACSKRTAGRVMLTASTGLMKGSGGEPLSSGEDR